MNSDTRPPVSVSMEDDLHGDLYGTLLRTWAKRLAERENECDRREARLDGREQSLVRILSATLHRTLTPEQGTE